MADPNLPSKLNDLTPVKGADLVDSQKGNTNLPNKPFSDYMNEPQGVEASNKATPMQIVAPQNIPSAPPTADSIHQQMRSTSLQLGDLQQKLNTPNLKLKPSQKYLLRGKLAEANQNIRQSAEKMGTPLSPPVDLRSKDNPIAKFLALITDGQTQLENATKMVKNLSTDGKSVNPANLLLVQIKLNRAQQQLEYSSVILSKAIEAMKSLFSVQI